MAKIMDVARKVIKEYKEKKMEEKEYKENKMEEGNELYKAYLTAEWDVTFIPEEKAVDIDEISYSPNGGCTMRHRYRIPVDVLRAAEDLIH